MFGCWKANGSANKMAAAVQMEAVVACLKHLLKDTGGVPMEDPRWSSNVRCWPEPAAMWVIAFHGSSYLLDQFDFLEPFF